MKELIQHFAEHFPINEDFEQALAERISVREFQKSEIVLDSADVCTESYFLVSGLMRLYFEEDGRELSEYFCGANQWINSPRSFTERRADIFFIEAIEETRALSINIEDLGFLFDEFPEMEEYSRQSVNLMLSQTMERGRSLRFHTALEKYEHFKKTYKEIHDRIPLGMIATYLGITSETLSRIRVQPRN